MYLDQRENNKKGRTTTKGRTKSEISTSSRSRSQSKATTTVAQQDTLQIPTSRRTPSSSQQIPTDNETSLSVSSLPFSLVSASSESVKYTTTVNTVNSADTVRCQSSQVPVSDRLSKHTSLSHTSNTDTIPVYTLQDQYSLTQTFDRQLLLLPYTDQISNRALLVVFRSYQPLKLQPSLVSHPSFPETLSQMA